MRDNPYRKFFALPGGPREARVLFALLEARPGGVPLNVLFTDSVEVPKQPFISQPSALMRVMISKLRKKLKVHGWAIRYEKTNESGRPWYRLEEVK